MSRNSVGGMGGLTSAAVSAMGPEDHVRGEGPEAIVYLDLACPRCSLAWTGIRELPLRLVLRHFPVASKHPRAPALHAAAEAAGLQGRFAEMWDSLLTDQAHQDDPHLWKRAERLGLDLVRFNRERRSEPVAVRVRRDFEGGIRAGVTGTPAAFVAGEMIGGDIAESLRELVGGASGPQGRSQAHL
jgi:protein-disulfide isomerase